MKTYGAPLLIALLLPFSTLSFAEISNMTANELNNAYLETKVAKDDAIRKLDPDERLPQLSKELVYSSNRFTKQKLDDESLNNPDHTYIATPNVTYPIDLDNVAPGMDVDASAEYITLTVNAAFSETMSGNDATTGIQFDVSPTQAWIRLPVDQNASLSDDNWRTLNP